MTLLILGLYLADIVTGFNFVLKCVFAVCGIIALVYTLFFAFVMEAGESDKAIGIFKICYKKYLFTLIFSVLAYIILPSKKHNIYSNWTCYRAKDHGASTK